MKAHRVTKNVKEIKTEGTWDELQLKKIFPETITQKISETNPSLYVK